VSEIADAYAIVHGIFNMKTLWERIEQLDNVIPAQLQLKMLDEARRIMRRASRWYIRHGNKTQSIEEAIASYRGTFDILSKNLQNYLVKSEFTQLENATQKYIDKGVPEDIAYQVASFSNMFSSFDLAQIVEADKHDTDVVAKLYYQLGSRLELHWFLDQINNQAVSNHWQALARASYREELDWQQRSIAANLLASREDVSSADQILDEWIESNQVLLKRWYHMMSEFKTSTTHEFAKFSVALRELMLLSVKSNH
jgi:glutamate dehydrogenase